MTVGSPALCGVGGIPGGGPAQDPHPATQPLLAPYGGYETMPGVNRTTVGVRGGAAGWWGLVLAHVIFQ